MKKNLELTVVGMQHRVTLHTRRKIHGWMVDNGPLEVTLVREPENEHDENAIKVVVALGEFKGQHLGYVSRQAASEIAPRLDSKKAKVNSAMVTTIYPEEGDGDLFVQLSVAKKTDSEGRKSL